MSDSNTVRNIYLPLNARRTFVVVPSSKIPGKKWGFRFDKWNGKIMVHFVHDIEKPEGRTTMVGRYLPNGELKLTPACTVDKNHPAYIAAKAVIDLWRANKVSGWTLTELKDKALDKATEGLCGGVSEEDAPF